MGNKILHACAHILFANGKFNERVASVVSSADWTNFCRRKSNELNTSDYIIHKEDGTPHAKMHWSQGRLCRKIGESLRFPKMYYLMPINMFFIVKNHWQPYFTDNPRIIFWDIMPCSLLKVNPCFGATCSLRLQDRRMRRISRDLLYIYALTLVCCSTYSLVLKMEARYSSETF
jgi:hypothetical protein